MVNEYTIKKYNNFFMIFINCFKSPIDLLEDIEKSFRQKNVLNAKVKIDGLLYYGNNDQRYIELSLENGELNNFKFLKIPKNHETRNKSMIYFNKNESLLDYSILGSISTE